MNDHDWQDELTAYVDGELDERRRSALEAAFADNPELRARVEQLRRTAEGIRALPPVAVSAQLRRNVLDAVFEPSWKERLGAWLSPSRLIPLSLAAATAAVAVAVLPRHDSDELTSVGGEQLALAQNLEMVADLDLLGLETPEDVAVVAALADSEESP
jgi:anti-sigma factor RsiW